MDGISPSSMDGISPSSICPPGFPPPLGPPPLGISPSSMDGISPSSIDGISPVSPDIPPISPTIPVIVPFLTLVTLIVYVSASTSDESSLVSSSMDSFTSPAVLVLLFELLVEFPHPTQPTVINPIDNAIAKYHLYFIITHSFFHFLCCYISLLIYKWNVMVI